MDAPVFNWPAIATQKDGKFDEAIALYRKTLDWDLADGTRTGFPRRMRPIQKKQNAGP